MNNDSTHSASCNRIQEEKAKVRWVPYTPSLDVSYSSWCPHLNPFFVVFLGRVFLFFLSCFLNFSINFQSSVAVKSAGECLLLNSPCMDMHS